MAELWPGGIEYSDGGAFPVTTDSILLADFVRVRPYSAVLELCCGAGLISLLLHHRAPGISVCAVELDAASAAAAERNFAANGLAGRVICGDLRDRACLPAAESCNICVCNPPYFPHGRGRVSPGAARAGARSELSCSFADVAAAASRSLRHGGKFVFVHRAERLVSVFEALTAARLMPKRLRFVQHRAASAPGLVLCEAVKGAGPDGLRVETPLVLYEENGTESAEFRRIYHMEEQDGR